MTQEEKAKAYDVAREKIAVRFGTNVAEEIFSEFEESEDEKIRKEIRNFIWGYPNKLIERDKWLAWLEKQKPIILTGDDLSTLKNWVGYIQDKASELELNDWFVEATEKVVNKMKTLLIQHPNIIPKEMDVDDTNFWLEKQGEQKNADKVEPKFKVGDWIIHKDNKNIPIKIIEKIGMYYRTVDTVNYHHNMYIDYAN